MGHLFEKDSKRCKIHTDCQPWLDEPIQHTPTPWIQNDNDIIGADGLGTLAMTTGKNRDENYDNAAFIVRAVNSHEELLEALRPFVKDGFGGFTKADVERAKKAIAKAEGK